MEKYQNKTAVVIGAGGIGREIIERLAESASAIIVADHNEAMFEPIRKIDKAAVIHTRKLDVRDSAAVADFFSFVRGTIGSPDFLFYTAGILTIEPFIETTPASWDRAVDVNLNGAFYCTQQAAELMIPERRGSILLLGSIAGTKARSGSRVNPVYNVTKAGIAALVNAAAMQLRPYGIRINCISPGPTATTMMDVQPPQVQQSIHAIMLDGRMNLPQEVAELALFIAAHGRCTGEDIGMGGGAGLGG